MRITLDAIGEAEPVIVTMYDCNEDLQLTINGQEVWIRAGDVLRLAALVNTQRELNKATPVYSITPNGWPPWPANQIIR